MSVTPRWIADVDRARSGLRIKTRTEFVRLAVEAVTRGDVVPAPLLLEAIQYIEEVQGHLRSDVRNRKLVSILDDAITVIGAAEDLELPEDMVWPR